MGINLVDLIIECTIRDGIEYLKANPDVVDDIFSPLTSMYASRKYGESELAKIKNMLQTKTIAIVHSFHEADAKSPCYSIQLGSESEAKERARLGDFEADVRVQLEGAELLPYVKIDPFTPTAYDQVSGKVSADDSVDTSLIFPGHIYVDGDGTEFEIKRGVSNVAGNKFFFIQKQAADINVVDPGLVKSFIDYSQHELRGETSAVNVLIGVHAKDALLTKYLYVILKYIMFSRKRDLIQRGLVNSSFQGSDFTRDLHYQGDMVYTRFFTVSGQVDDSWNSDQVELADRVEIDATPVDSTDEDEDD